MGRARKWTYTGEKGRGRTVILHVHYLGQLGKGFSRKVTRTIEMLDTQTLDDLHEAIIYRSFGWDDPHMYSYFFDNIPYSKARGKEYCCSTEPDPFTGKRANPTSTTLGELDLVEGQRFLFVFDFGDDHHFRIKVVGFGRPRSEPQYPVILEEKGRAPKQYY